MSGLKLNGMFARIAAIAALAAGLGVSLPAVAQHKANADDMEVPTNDMKVVQAGRAKFAQRCAFCHGGDGHGAKGPCLTCGTFHYAGNTNTSIYVTIATGVPKNLGGTMGAFGTTMSREEILSVITFLRWEEKRRIAAGEVPDPYKNKDEKPMEFPTTN
jgi:mono/diheme cytochrome c family protein